VKKAKLFQRQKDGRVECQACSWQCKIAKGKTGLCGVRQNIGGDLFLLVYGQAVGLFPDPVEKKPLYHFLPGTSALSFGTLGCNFACAFCQNWQQSQLVKEVNPQERFAFIEKHSAAFSPRQIVELARRWHCHSIAYTYNEPAVFVEYAYETMVLAKKAGLKNIFVSNGFESLATFNLVRDYLDAINIDLKSFRPDFYQKICRGKITPVLENIKRFFQAGIWVEVTTLIIPHLNDSEKELTAIARFLKDISEDIPWHVTAFHPDYQMRDRSPTPVAKLKEAFQIGKKIGLNYIYLGNVVTSSSTVTRCPVCQRVLVAREGYQLLGPPKIKDGQCIFCHQRIAGVW